MGWFGSLFKKKEIETLTVDLDDLQDWFDDQTKDMLSGLNSAIIQKIEDINETKQLMKEKIDVLETAELRNPNIPERAKQIMQGSRETYIRFMRQFLDRLEIPHEVEYENLKEFISNFEKTLLELNKSTSRSYYVLQEFFAVESSEIAKHLKNIDVAVRSLLANDYSDIINLKEMIDDMYATIKNKSVAENNIAGEEKKMVSIDASINEVRNNIEKHRISKQFKELERLKKDKEEIKIRYKNIDDELTQLFSPLDKPLRKYLRIALDNQDIIERYTKSSSKGFIEDKDMKILDVLEKIKKSIEAESVELKDKDKTLQKIDEVTRQKLEAIRLKLKNVNDKLDEVNRCISLNSASRELEELEYKLAHLKDKKKRAEDEMLKLQKQSMRHDPDTLKEDIIEKIKELLYIDLTIE